MGADLDVMDSDSKKMRGERPYIFAKVKHDEGVTDIVNFIIEEGGL